MSSTPVTVCEVDSVQYVHPLLIISKLSFNKPGKLISTVILTSLVGPTVAPGAILAKLIVSGGICLIELSTFDIFTLRLLIVNDELLFLKKGLTL